AQSTFSALSVSSCRICPTIAAFPGASPPRREVNSAWFLPAQSLGRAAMPAGKRAVVIALALAAGLLSGSKAQAQIGFSRALALWRANAWWRAQEFGGGLPGGEIVGTSSFAAGRQTTATFTAAQWQELVAAQARQTPTMTAAQWQQLVAAQARLPQLP